MIIKVELEKCQKFIPINVMFIKNDFIIILILRDKIGLRTGRLLFLISTFTRRQNYYTIQIPEK